MLRFRGFRATFNISKNNQSNLLHYNDSPGVSLTGAYRTNKDELFGNIDYPNPPKKITPSMVSLPASQSGHRKEISKSTNNLAQPLNETVNITKSTPNIPEAVAVPLTRTQIKEQKKLEKKRLDEQKKQARLAAKEQEKAEKLRKEREKQLLKTQAEEKKKSTRLAPPPPRTQNAQLRPEITPQSGRPQSTNTLESSISKSSGPPPYSPKDVVQDNNKSDHSENVTFAEQDSSWEMVSQHRQQINRPLVVKSLPKQTHLDLNYNVGTKNATDNSNA